MMQAEDIEWLLRWKVSVDCTSERFWDILNSWATTQRFSLSEWELDAATLSLFYPRAASQAGKLPPAYRFHVEQESSAFGPRAHVRVYLNYRLPSEGQEVARKFWRMFRNAMDKQVIVLTEVEVPEGLARAMAKAQVEQVMSAQNGADDILPVEPQVASDERTEPQVDSSSPKIVITDPIPTDMGIKQLTDWLIEYQMIQHPSSPPSVFPTSDSFPVELLYRISDCWIYLYLEPTMETPGKVTITKMTCSPYSWKDYFAKLVEAIRRQWPSTQYYTCFMSYSSKDQEFAEQLHNDLQSKGVRCWFAPEDMRIGDRIRPSIDQAVRSYDKLLLVLSEHSIDSDWVEKEVEAAFEEERKRKVTILFPIRLDSAVMETDQAWAADIRRTRHIGDFTNWKNHDAYQKAFERLLRDLKAEDVVEADT